MSDNTCTYCGQEGHRAHACPRRRNALIGRLQRFRRPDAPHWDTAQGQMELQAMLDTVDDLVRDSAQAERDALLRKFDGYVPADQASSMRYRIAELEAQVAALQEELARQVLPAVGWYEAGPRVPVAEVITDPAMIEATFEADAAVDRAMADLLDDQCDGWAGMPMEDAGLLS